MTVEVLVDARYELGEGPLWHADRSQLFWFSITTGELNACAVDGSGHQIWSFGEPVSAGAIIDRSRLLVATAGGLEEFEIDTEKRTPVGSFKSGRPATRANDGRAGPGGCFWIGTMGLNAEPNAGTLYRYDQSTLAPKQTGLTIPNSTCFSLDGTWFYYADSRKRAILKWRLDPESGDTIGEPEMFIDLGPEGLVPDGSVTDCEGCIWNAQYGAARVARYDPKGKFIEALAMPTAQVTCPAFGGDDLNILFVTSAWQDMDEAQRRSDPLAGAVFAVEMKVSGMPEFRVDSKRS